MIDYHLHTKRCGHAEGEMAEYVEQAAALGLKEIGFSDHLPFLHKRDPRYTMPPEEFPQYVAEVEHLRKRYPQLRIKLGVEADFIPGYEKKLQELLCAYPLDYVIGSVHFIEGWGFDMSEEIEGWEEQDVDHVYREYFSLLRRSARVPFFDIIAHPDVVKKFGHRPKAAMGREIEETVRVFREEGKTVEINTSGLRKPIREIYPSQSILEVCRRWDVPIVFGSDAHAPEEVGKDFNQAVLLAKKVGYGEALIYEGREIAGRYTF
ncbi:MAG: histidinol-phosphatase HisJ [Candidatus Omnitrophota bacterium]